MNCLLQNADYCKKPRCESCGFNKEEHDRRIGIGLVDENGVRHYIPSIRKFKDGYAIHRIPGDGEPYSVLKDHGVKVAERPFTEEAELVKMCREDLR